MRNGQLVAKWAYEKGKTEKSEANSLKMVKHIYKSMNYNKFA